MVLYYIKFSKWRLDIGLANKGQCHIKKNGVGGGGGQGGSSEPPETHLDLP